MKWKIEIYSLLWSILFHFYNLDFRRITCESVSPFTWNGQIRTLLVRTIDAATNSKAKNTKHTIKEISIAISKFELKNRFRGKTIYLKRKKRWITFQLFYNLINFSDISMFMYMRTFSKFNLQLGSYLKKFQEVVVIEINNCNYVNNSL